MESGGVIDDQDPFEVIYRQQNSNLTETKSSMSSLTDIPLSNRKQDRFSRFGWKGKKQQQKFQLELDDIADSPPRKEKKKDIMSTNDDVQTPWYQVQTQSIEHAIQYTVGQQEIDASSSSISIPDTSRKHLDGLVIFPPPSLSKTSRHVSDIESARSTAGGRSEGFMAYMLEGNSRKKKMMITSVIAVMIICIIAITVAALTSTQNETGNADADAVLPAHQVEQPKEDGTSSPIIDIDVTEDDNIRVNSTTAGNDMDTTSSSSSVSSSESITDALSPSHSPPPQTGDTAEAVMTDPTIITDLSSSSEATTVSTTTISSTRPQTTTATSTRPQSTTSSSSAQPQTTTTTTKSTTSSTSTATPANPDWLSELASTSNPSTSPSVSPTQKSTTTAPSSSPSSTATTTPPSTSTSTPTPFLTINDACIAKCDQDAEDMFKKDLDKVVDKCMEKANCIKKNCEKDCEKDSEKKREDLLEKAVAKALECKQTCQSNTLGGESGVIVHQQIKPRRSSPFEIELELLFP